jgi:prolipoprotein diacylglyceryl transferase
VFWNINSDLQLGGLHIHLYGLFFALGLLFGGLVVMKIMNRINVAQTYFIYSFLGIFIGARLFHCLFYEPIYFFTHPLDIFLPFAFDNDKLQFVGYQGLASHGGTVGLIFALWLFARKNKVNFLQICDIFAIATPLAGGFIRLGNLMNSEIIGKPTSAMWAFIFPKIDLLPRHPAQLYEAVWYFLFAVFLLILFKKNGFKFRYGFYMGTGFLGVAVFRFLIEFIKEPQVNFETKMYLNIGQILSIPFILAGFFLLISTTRTREMRI